MTNTYHLVQSCYGDIAKKSATSPEQDGEKNIAMAFGYSEDDLLSLPEKTNLGLSCGNPVAYANVKEVRDLHQSYESPTQKDFDRERL